MRNPRSFQSAAAGLIATALALALAGRAPAAVSLGGVLAHSPDDISGFAALAGNDNTVNLTLPFTFVVEGVGYSNITLSTNGWIEFGGNTSGDSDPSNDCLPTSAHTNPFLAAYWDDLNPFGTGVRYGTVGSAPNRVFIADYEVDLTSGSEGSDDLRFQVQLHEGSNTITVRFRDQQSGTNGAAATLGFQGAGGASASTVQPLGCNVKILDDNRPDEGWSADVGRAGQVTLSAIMQTSPDDLVGFTVLSGDNAVTTASLPFNVNLGGVNYNTVAISTNGWLEFGGNTAGDSDPSNDCLPTAAHTNPFLAAYWDDLNTWDTNIRYATIGTAPNRVFVADFKVDLTSGSEGSDDLRFQVQVHERSNLINVRYWDKQSGANGQQATIGYQAAGGASAAAYPLTCDAKILDDNDSAREGWSIQPKASGAMSLHSVNAFSPDDINGTNIPGLLSFSGDDVTRDVTLPFAVVLDGVTYTTLTLSTNGWLEFGANTSGNSDPTNDCLPTPAHTNPFVAAFWDDMQTAGASAIQYGTVGASPDRTFLANFFLDTKVSGDDGNDDVRMQIQIHEGSNEISVKYPPSEPLANGQTATIGYQGAGGASAQAMAMGCNARVLDDNISDTGWSVSPLPICGNGVNEPRGGEQCDLGAGNGAATSCCTTACAYRAAGQTCRVGGGAPCDLNETCTGASATCPADDAPTQVGVTCRLGSGDACDPDELCNGAPGVACPSNVIAPPSTQCRAGSGDVCDPPESCTGVAGQTCPANVINGASTTCRLGSGDGCDANEVCSGIAGATCPPDDAPLNVGVVCRTGSGDVCDVNETCSGAPGATCPADDAPGKAGSVCRVGSAGDICDENELCTGAPGAVCPPDDAPSKLNVVCRPGSGDICDPEERCTGVAGQGCPPNIVANPTTVCRTGSGDACDPNETCTAIPGQPCPANVVTPAGTTCRAASGTCDVAEQCSGGAGQLCPPDAFAPATTPCDADANVCTLDACDGSGGCMFSAPLDCEDGNTCTQDACDPQDGCFSTGTPATTCTASTKALLKIRDPNGEERDSVKFKWGGGPALIADMGNPTQTTRYELCIYDNRGVRMAMGVPPGAGWDVSGSPSSPTGYRYKDATASQDGIKSILTKASNLGKAKFKVTGKGTELPDQEQLPLQYPVTVQLYASDGDCWQAEFGQGDTLKNDDGGYTGKTP
jgi:hypothetical protein